MRILFFLLLVSFLKNTPVFFLLFQETFFRNLWGALTLETSSLLFFALTIGRCVLIYCDYYMGEEEVGVFKTLLSSFLFLILCIFSRRNLFTIFFGWEGVGVLSFLLIGWYSSREEATLGAKKAVFYNRVTDFLFLALLVRERRTMFLLGGPAEGGWPGAGFSLTSLVFLRRLLFVFLGKSAQFIFHPWLTRAMEGPTPVRSLLHRSTIVVAGVFCLFLFSHSLFFLGESGTGVSPLTLLLLTLLMTSLRALFMKDVKKIIALSTTSQLSFMGILIMGGLPSLGLFHLICHGFFKALLFLRRGVSIHRGGDVQDHRKLKWETKSPLEATLFLFSRVGLIGLPFLGAFFSKHLILNFIIRGNGGGSSFRRLFFLRLLLTTAYSLRLISSLASTPLFNNRNITVVRRDCFPSHNQKKTFSLLTLFLGVRLFGGLTSSFFSPLEELSGRSSIVFSIFLILLGGSLLGSLTKNFSPFWVEYGFSSRFLRDFFSRGVRRRSFLLEGSFEKNILLSPWKRSPMKVIRRAGIKNPQSWDRPVEISGFLIITGVVPFLTLSFGFL